VTRRHALVTGGAGFIGSHLVDALLAHGWRVSVVDNFDPFYDPEVKEQNIAGHLAHPKYELHRVDIRDMKAMQDRLDDSYDVIVHLAAKAGVRPSIEDPAAYREVNISGTHNLLELARLWDVKQFVFASSSSVYGMNPNVPWSEDESVLQPISPYAATKVAAELLGHTYSHLYGLRFVALRYFTVYGPRQRPDLAIHKFIRLMLQNKPIPLYGDGSSRRDYTYVDDIVRGTLAAMSYTDSEYEVFNLGSGNPITLLEMVQAIEKALGKNAEIVWLPEQPGDVPRTWADVGKAERVLSNLSPGSLLDHVAVTADWVRNSTEWREK